MVVGGLIGGREEVWGLVLMGGGGGGGGGDSVLDKGCIGWEG